MDNTNISALRRDAYSLLERVPDEELEAVVRFMRNMSRDAAQKKDLKARRAAFERLQEIINSVPPAADLDDEKELAEWREEKFGNAGVD